MKGVFGKDASGRIIYECLDVSAAQYLSIRDQVVKNFDITPMEEFVQGFDEMFQSFQRDGLVIEIGWDIWSGLCIVAKTPCANDLLKNIGFFLEKTANIVSDNKNSQ